jgi:hypothetical protein
MIYVAVVVVAALLVVVWSLSTNTRRDELASEFARQVLLVDGIADAGGDDASIRVLFPYLARSKQGSMVVLAKNAQGAAEIVATEAGMEVAISCLLGRHRIVAASGGRWAVAVLPPVLGFLGKSCEHGGHVVE